MSQGSKHNLYELAFGLPAETKTPDAYTLLKLDPFTSDAALIEKAVLQRWSELQVLQGFGDGSEVTQLETEVNAARDLLLDNNRRAKLDELLRQRGVTRLDLDSEKSTTLNEKPIGAGDANQTAAEVIPRADPSDSSPDKREPGMQVAPKDPELAVTKADTTTSNLDAKSETAPNADDTLNPDAETKSSDESKPEGDGDAVQPANIEQVAKSRWIRKLIGLALLLGAVAVGIQFSPDWILDLNFDRFFAAREIDNLDSSPIEIVPPDRVPADSSPVVQEASPPKTKSKLDAQADPSPVAETAIAWKSFSSVEAGVGITAAATSPDGSLLAVATGDRRIRILAMSNPEQILYSTYQLPPGEVRELQFSRDGQTLLARTPDTIHVWRRTDNWHDVSKVPHQNCAQCSLSADGKKLAIVSEPNKEVVVFDLTVEQPEATFRKSSNFVRATFLGDSGRLVTASDFGVASGANGNYSELGNQESAVLQISDTNSGDFTDLFLVPSLAKQASQIRAIAADETAAERVLATLSSSGSGAQQLNVWVLPQLSPDRSKRHEVAVELDRSSSFRLSISVATRSVCAMTERGFAVFDWNLAELLQFEFNKPTGLHVVDVNLAKRNVLAIDPKASNTLVTVSFDELRKEPQPASSTEHRVAVAGPSDRSRPVGASFWKAEKSTGAPWLKANDATLDIFTQPNCRVRFVGDDLLIVRRASEGGVDRMIGFDSTTDPPRQRFETQIATGDLLTVSPDARYLLRLGRGPTGAEISAFEIEAQTWSRPVSAESARGWPLNFSVTDWPEPKSWRELSQLRQASAPNSATNGLRFSPPQEQRLTPYVFFGLVGEDWVGTVGVDVRALFAGLPSSVSGIEAAWPIVMSDRDAKVEGQRIARGEFSSDGSVAICQFVAESAAGSTRELSESKLARFMFHANFVDAIPGSMATIDYRDLWEPTQQGRQVVVTNRGGLQLCQNGEQQSLGHGPLAFVRDEKRSGTLAVSGNGRTLLLIDPLGNATCLNWSAPSDEQRQAVRLSGDGILESPRSDAWIEMQAGGVVPVGGWRSLKPGGVSLRLCHRRLSTSFSSSGHLVAVGTPDGVAFWKLPAAFVEFANKSATDHAGDTTNGNASKAIRPATLNKIVDVEFSGNQLVVGVAGKSDQLEFYRQENGSFVRNATATVAASSSKFVGWGTKNSVDGLAVATDQGELFLVPQIASAVARQPSLSLDASPLKTDSPSRADTNIEHPAAIRTISTSLGFDLFAYTTPKGYFLVDATKTSDQIYEVSISDPDKPAFVAFSYKVGESRTSQESLMAALRFTRLGNGAQGYKLYLHTVNRRAGKWQVTHLANVELASGEAVANPIVLERASQDAIVIVPCTTGALIYSLIGTKLEYAGRLGSMSVTALAASEFGDQIAVGTETGQLLLWGKSTFTSIKRPQSSAEIFDVLTSKAEVDATSAYQPLRTIAAHSGSVTAIVFEPNGLGLVTGSSSGEVTRWATSTE